MEKEYFELDTSRPIIKQSDLDEIKKCNKQINLNLENPDKTNNHPIMKILKEMEIKQGNIKLQ